MPRLRGAEQAFKLARTSQQQYVCRTCRAQFHTSRVLSADRTWMEHIKSYLRPSKKSDDAEKQREELQKKKAQEQEQARQQDLYSGPETKTHRGIEYEVAALVDPATSRDYVKATTWDGMERIGSPKWVKEQADRGEQYVGFAPKKRLQLTDEQWTKLIHHVAVEIITLRKARRGLNDACLPRRGGADNWLRTRTAKITFDNNGKRPALVHVPASVEEEILQSIPSSLSKDVSENEEPGQSPVNQAPEPIQPSEDLILQEISGATIGGELDQYAEGEKWMDIPLDTPTIKFAILKRLVQLTGHRIPDIAMSEAKTLADLYNALKVKEPPKKLAHSEQMKRLNVELPNVTVHPTRRTPIHKEKELGRWKIIEDELRARDLPITGSRHRTEKQKLDSKGNIIRGA